MAKGGRIPYEKITDVQEVLSRLTVEYWLEHNFLTFKWWLLVGLSTVPLIIWGIVLDKTRAKEIIMYGLLISLAASILDTIGFAMGFWGYPVKLIPINPPYFPVDFVYLPVMYMLIYQYFLHWKGFIIMNILASSFYSFVGEPVFEWLGLYITYNWQYLISLPIYIALAIFLKWFVQLFIQAEEQQTGTKSSLADNRNQKLLFLPILSISAGIVYWTIKITSKKLKPKGKKRRRR